MRLKIWKFLMVVTVTCLSKCFFLSSCSHQFLLVNPNFCFLGLQVSLSFQWLTKQAEKSGWRNQTQTADEVQQVFIPSLDPVQSTFCQSYSSDGKFSKAQPPPHNPFNLLSSPLVSQPIHLSHNLILILEILITNNTQDWRHKRALLIVLVHCTVN